MHPRAEPAPATIELPRSAWQISSAETFGAEEAADLFEHYFQSGDIPAHYALRPIECWAADGDYVQPGKR